LIEDVFKGQRGSNKFKKLDLLRSAMLRKKYLIEITDYGTGKNKNEYTLRFESMSSVAKKSAITDKFGRLLYRLVDEFKPATILELGTSIGFSTMYMALAHPATKIYTVEGCPKKAEQAQSNFKTLGVENVEQHVGRFDIVLPDLIQQVKDVDFVFIDGNHTYKSTIKYFEMLLPIANNDTVFVFDDIHWSDGMERAWNVIAKHNQTTVSIDIFRFGIVFLKKELSKQHFVIKF